MMKDQRVVYPTTYTIASKASQAHQSTYILLKKLEYGTVVLAAALAMIPASPNSHWRLAVLFGGLALFVAIVVLLVERNFQYHKGWYKSRALAEAVKAESWKFRCACGPYSQGKTGSKAISAFLSFLSTVRASLDATEHIAGYAISGDEVTEEMRDSRCKLLPERVSLYREARVLDQIEWYSDKANRAKKNSNRFFHAALVCLLGGLLAAILQFLGYPSEWSVVGIFAAMAVALFGWAQVRRYETLSITYTKATDELRSISQLILSVKEDDDLCAIASDTEMIISKEHTIWARKGDVV